MDEQSQKDVQAIEDESIESSGKGRRVDEVEVENSDIESQNDQGDESVIDGPASVDSEMETDTGEAQIIRSIGV